MDIGLQVKAACERALQTLFQAITHTEARPLGFIIMAIPDRDHADAEPIMVVAFSDASRRREVLQKGMARLRAELNMPDAGGIMRMQ